MMLGCPYYIRKTINCIIPFYNRNIQGADVLVRLRELTLNARHNGRA
jgi:hypothetical protein